jgi:glutathione S-transferase
MKLYWGPNTCAIEIAALLEEAGIPYTDERVDTANGAQRSEAFKAINPKGRLPALARDDGTVITEYPTIARWIARTRPEAGLVPEDAEAEMKASEMMDYTVSTIHGQGFRRIFFSQEFCKDEAHRSAVKADGRAIVEEGFAILSRQLGDRPYAGGEHFSIADATIFYTTRWAKLTRIEMPANIAALADRVRSRPAFEKVLARMV